MAYSTQVDILNQLEESILIQLTDDENTGVVNPTVMTRAIADADATIDSYCQGRYTIPLSPVPDKIRQISVDIAIYNLYSRRGGAPEIRSERNKEALRFLENVAGGKITLGIEPEPPGGYQQIKATCTLDDRIFTIEKTSTGETGTLDYF
jgi:phage gp36-like protein